MAIPAPFLSNSEKVADAAASFASSSEVWALSVRDSAQLVASLTSEEEAGASAPLPSEKAVQAVAAAMPPVSGLPEEASIEHCSVDEEDEEELQRQKLSYMSSNMQVEMARLKHEVELDNLRKQIVDLEAENLALKEKSPPTEARGSPTGDAAVVEQDARKQHVAKLEAAVANLKEELEAQREELENLEAEASSGTAARQENRKLQQQLAIANEEWEQERIAVQNAHGAQLSELQAQSSAVQRENDADSVGKLEAIIAELKEEIINLEAEASGGTAARQEVNALQQQLALTRLEWEQERNDMQNAYNATASELQAMRR